MTKHDLARVFEMLIKLQASQGEVLWRGAPLTLTQRRQYMFYLPDGVALLPRQRWVRCHPIAHCFPGYIHHAEHSRLLKMAVHRTGWLGI